MAVIDNMVNEIEKHSNRILQKINETSYGTEPHELWEVLGSIQYLTELNVYLAQELKKEINAERTKYEENAEDIELENNTYA